MRNQSLSPPLQHPVLRFTTILVFDALICATGLWVALLLRFDSGAADPYSQALPAYLALLVPSRLVANLAMRVHRWSFRLAGLHDAVRVAVAGVLGSVLFVLLTYALRLLSPPRSVVALELFVSVTAMVAFRFGPRLAHIYRTRLSLARKDGAKRTLIVGAGAAGEMLVRDLQRSSDHPYRVVGFVDDNRAKWTSLVSGHRVFGGIDTLRDVVVKQRIQAILIAIPRDSQGVVRDVVLKCAGLDLQIKALPVSFIYFQDRGAASVLQDLAPEDLLSRRRVMFDEHERSAFTTRRVLVTGAAGSIGSEICRQLLAMGTSRVLGVDINENGLYLLEQRLKREFPGERFVTQLADIRDAGRVDSLLQAFRPQDVFHAAAHKHVPLMEAAPCEAIKNNILGTQNVLFAAERLHVDCVVFISTDKAVAPTSVMGATKRVGEIMTRAINERSGTRGCAVRFGNVLGSDGSVVPLFRQQIEAGGPVTVTHPDVRRYFMTIPEAVGLVLKAAYGRFGGLCVLNMGEPIRIIDLARQMITMAGYVPEVDIPIVLTGLRPGEKLNEELVTDDEQVALKAQGTIKVVMGPPPPSDLWSLVTELGVAAAREDEREVLRLLKIIVPTYQPAPAPLPAVAS